MKNKEKTNEIIAHQVAEIYAILQTYKRTWEYKSPPNTDSVEMRLNFLEDELSKTTEQVNVNNNQITHIFRKLEEQRALFKYHHGKKDISDVVFLKTHIDAWIEFENKNRYELRKKFARSTLDKINSFITKL